VANLLIGKHDFSAFGTPPRPGNSTVRTVMEAVWNSHADEWFFEICADAFLYHMVRRLVYVQVAVGLGKFPAQVMSDLLEGRSCNLPAGLARPNGLTLVEVTYVE
jgi:tRNA pseudouridine38-40 synthase